MKPLPAFDGYADGYDQHFTASAIGRAQRRQVWRALLPCLKDRMDILELNCGTGEDAIRLAGAGHNVLATDLSEAMIRVAEAKKEAALPLPGLQFLQAGFQGLPAILGGRRFDLIFSNFGGLNCISPEENRQLAGVLHGCLRPAGLLFLVLMSRCCWWERAYFFMKGEAGKSSRRRGPGPAVARIGESSLNVWYYTPKEVEALCAPGFRREGLHPIGLFTPPSYLEPLFARRQRWLSWLEKLDALLDFPYLAGRADHFAAILKKNG